MNHPMILIKPSRMACGSRRNPTDFLVYALSPDRASQERLGSQAGASILQPGL